MQDASGQSPRFAAITEDLRAVTMRTEQAARAAEELRDRILGRRPESAAPETSEEAVPDSLAGELEDIAGTASAALDRLESALSELAEETDY